MARIAEARAPDVKKPTLTGANKARGVARINLRAVSEVLASRGVDPTVAILDILQPVDENGKAMPCMLDHDVQARIYNELLQYTQPKLKSVEIRAKVIATSFDVNDDQARRIAEEFLKASQA